MKMTHRPMGMCVRLNAEDRVLDVHVCQKKKEKKKKVDRRCVGGKRKREREKQGEEAV